MFNKDIMNQQNLNRFHDAGERGDIATINWFLSKGFISINQIDVSKFTSAAKRAIKNHIGKIYDSNADKELTVNICIKHEWVDTGMPWLIFCKHCDIMFDAKNEK